MAEWLDQIHWLFFFFFKTSFLGVCGPLLKSLLNLLQYYFVFWLQGMWDLRSQTRDQTCTPALEHEVLTTRLLGKSHSFIFNTCILTCYLDISYFSSLLVMPIWFPGFFFFHILQTILQWISLLTNYCKFLWYKWSEVELLVQRVYVYI